jgi:hypothetical protein
VLGVVVPDELAPDHQPLRVVVEPFGLVGDRGDLLPQRRLRQVPQQRDRPDDAAQLPERPIGAEHGPGFPSYLFKLGYSASAACSLAQWAAFTTAISRGQFG